MIDFDIGNGLPVGGAAAVEWGCLCAGIGSQLSMELDVELETLWFWFHPHPRPCFNPQVLEEILSVQRQLVASRGRILKDREMVALRYVVAASRSPGVFNLGGDLSLFLECIDTQDRTRLACYAHACVDTILNHFNGYGCHLNTISLVQGRTLGGGLECALASELIIAERQADFGFPEIKFNLFPGMGGFALATRKVDAACADRLIVEGGMHSASTMADVGIVDVICEKGMGVSTVLDFIGQARRDKQAQLVRYLRDAVLPLPEQQMQASIDTWVDAAMELRENDLRLIRRLMTAQDTLTASIHV
jgi:DSF synthase